MKRKIIGIFFIVSFFYILSTGFTPVSAENALSLYPSDSISLVKEVDTSIKVKVKIDIDNAYYCDEDKDSKEDDVAVHFTLQFGVEDWDDIYYYKLDVILKLPSGLTYIHQYYLKTKPSDHSVLYMYNHAAESGWYTVGMVCTAYLANGNNINGHDSLIFDPPEGIGGTEPPTTRLFI